MYKRQVKLFVRFALAKGLISYGMELMLALLNIVQGVISSVSYTHLNESMSISNQKLMLRDFAEKHGMFQYEYYVDDGYRCV